MVKYKVEFIPNSDGITCSFFVNSQLIDKEVPFVPSRLVDSRGIALFYFFLSDGASKKSDFVMKFETTEFINDTVDERRELKRLYDYLLNPVYVFSEANNKN